MEHATLKNLSLSTMWEMMVTVGVSVMAETPCESAIALIGFWKSFRDDLGGKTI
jgi:hypothetical protein